MKLLFRLEIIISYDYGLQLNLFTKQQLLVSIFRIKNTFVAENLLRFLVSKNGKHTVYTDGSTWFEEACSIIGLKHYLHSPIEESLIEMVMQYSRIELSFDDDLSMYAKLNAIYFM